MAAVGKPSVERDDLSTEVTAAFMRLQQQCKEAAVRLTTASVIQIISWLEKREAKRRRDKCNQTRRGFSEAAPAQWR
jgi:hypothetical protein